MARTPKNLTAGAITSTTLTTIYTGPTGFNTVIRKFVLTNNSTESFTVDIFRNDGTADFLYKRASIPGGIGRDVPIYVGEGIVVNSGDAIKLQASAANTFNYHLDGTEASLTT